MNKNKTTDAVSAGDGKVALQSQTIVSLRSISKEFDGEQVLSEISLDIHDNEFVTLLGPSGCGKTTILRIIAGFVTPDEGDVYFGGKRINDLPPYKRELNTVFQKYALFPHLNVYENVAFGLRLRKKKDKLSEKEIADRVKETLALVNLSGFERRNVELLSGGQQQRVAIARALVNHPKVLLLDEPLSALDLKLRKDMQTELKNIQLKTGITFIFVTHDQEEALSMSDTVVVMAEGKIQQIGTPTDIYNELVNAFVADFIGESNIIDGVMLEDFSVRFAGHTFECVDRGFKKNQRVDVVVRPEDVDVVPPEKGMVVGTVTSVVFKGVHYEMIVDIDNFKWMIQTTDYVAPEARVGLYIEPDAIHIMERSEYSGRFGDYSSFSDELDRLSNPNPDGEEYEDGESGGADIE
ncbi:MAG: ABC transporter ATP-binding protein [Clostridia bacterium]|nr:ABC transporter ATP-binding protein [Clostridia bacterium]